MENLKPFVLQLILSFLPFYFLCSVWRNGEKESAESDRGFIHSWNCAFSLALTLSLSHTHTRTHTGGRAHRHWEKGVGAEKGNAHEGVEAAQVHESIAHSLLFLSTKQKVSHFEIWH